MKFLKKSGLVMSSSRMQVVLRDGMPEVAQTFGGNVSRSGATKWPEWVEEGSVEILALSSITKDFILESEDETIICFVGGGHRPVVIYMAKRQDVLEKLDLWHRWRTWQPLAEITEVDRETRPANRRRGNAEEPIVKSDAEWIARSVSYRELKRTEGVRLTDHEVSRYAEELQRCWSDATEQFSWYASMGYGWKAVANDAYGRPGPWTLCEEASIQNKTLAASEILIIGEEFFEEE